MGEQLKRFFLNSIDKPWRYGIMKTDAADTAIRTETDTTMNAIDTTRRDGSWVCYRCTSARAVELFRADDLDDCRDWAELIGYDGIVIGSPSLPWKTDGYSVAYVNPNGDFDIVEEFEAESDAAANAYVESEYGDDEDWYVLNSEGRNINGGRY